MSWSRKTASIAGLLLLSASPLLAVNGGALDSANHPAVGFIYGTLSTDACLGQVLGCTGVLVAPTVFLTSAECADSFANAHQYGYDLKAVWVSFNPSSPFDCSGPSTVQQIAVNPAWDPAAADPAGNVGVMILADAAAPAPAGLPAEGRIDGLPITQIYTVVAYGDGNGGPSTSALDLERRSTTALSRKVDAEQLTLSLRQAVKGSRPCIGQLNEAGPVYVGAGNEIVSLVTSHMRGSCWVADSQRLDVPSVRDFLSGYVALP